MAPSGPSAITDPALDRVFARGARTTILAWTDRWLELVPAPETRGDLYVKLEALLPTKLSDRERDLIEQLQRIRQS